MTRKSVYWFTARRSKFTGNNRLQNPSLQGQTYLEIWTWIWSISAKVKCKKKKKKMKNCPSGILRSILNASWFVRNDDARETIKIPTVEEEITNYANAYLNGVKIT